MAIYESRQLTAEAFDRLYEAGEYGDTRVEYINGKIIESPSNPRVSKIAGWILTFINIYLMKNDIGQTSGEAGGYKVSGERFAPDVAFISYDKQSTPLAGKGYNPNPPDLAVEVISDPSNKQEMRDLRVKLMSYLAAGVVVWVIDPNSRSAEIYRAGQPAELVDEKGLLTAPAVLPDFELKLADIFRKLPTEDDGTETEA